MSKAEPDDGRYAQLRTRRIVEMNEMLFLHAGARGCPWKQTDRLALRLEPIAVEFGDWRFPMGARSERHHARGPGFSRAAARHRQRSRPR